MTGQGRCSPQVLADLFAELSGEVNDTLPVIRLHLDDGGSLDVFRAERLRELPLTWKIRAALGEVRPREVTGIIMATTDGRLFLTTAVPDEGAQAMLGKTVVGASRGTRTLGDLAELIAQRVRRQIDDG